jgi:hypothetical protein
MRGDRLTVLLALFLVSIATPALADFGPIWITPSRPVIGQPVQLHVAYSGRCEAIGTSASWPNGENPEESTEGTTVAVLFYGTVVDYGDWCLVAPGVASFDLGAFSGGTYSIDVSLWHNDNDNGTPEILPLGDVPMVVSATPAYPAPVKSPLAMAAIASLLAIAGGAAILRR